MTVQSGALYHQWYLLDRRSHLSVYTTGGRTETVICMYHPVVQGTPGSKRYELWLSHESVKRITDICIVFIFLKVIQILAAAERWSRTMGFLS